MEKNVVWIQDILQVQKDGDLDERESLKKRGHLLKGVIISLPWQLNISFD